MCEANGKLIITYDDGSYLKGKIGHNNFYIPRKGGERIKKSALAHEGQIVNATIGGHPIGGMLLRIEGGNNGHNRNLVPHRISSTIPTPIVSNRVLGFWDIGGYTWVCRNCGARIHSTLEPRFCPKCSYGKEVK